MTTDHDLQEKIDAAEQYLKSYMTADHDHDHDHDAHGLTLSKTGYRKLENLVEKYVLGSSDAWLSRESGRMFDAIQTEVEQAAENTPAGDDITYELHRQFSLNGNPIVWQFDRSDFEISE
jgi:hypothetical protein